MSRLSMDRSVMRLYFDLRNSEYTVPDVRGVEVPDLTEAGRVALKMIGTLREEDPSAAQDWSGWTLQAVDAAGSTVFSTALSVALTGLLFARRRSLSAPRPYSQS